MKKKYLIILGSCMFVTAMFSGCKARSTDRKTVQEKAQESKEEKTTDLDDHAGIVKDNVVAGTEITADDDPKTMYMPGQEIRKATAAAPAFQIGDYLAILGEATVADLLDHGSILIPDSEVDSVEHEEAPKEERKIILSIDGLINEPVVQGDDNSFYLSHSFTKETERKGCLFADYRYRYGNNNLVIYGHNNYDGRGFSILSKYKDSLFAESHNEIVFIREDGTVNWYRVFLVVNYDTEDISVCDPFLQDLPESFLVRIRKYPVYYYNDSIADLMERMIPTLILSTCDTEAFGQSGRLLVAGVQISSSANRKNDCKPFI